MAKPEPQPTEAQEQANAAYVYRKHIQADLVQVMRDPQVKLQTAEWWFERYIAAYCRQLAAHKAVDDERAQRKQADGQA